MKLTRHASADGFLAHAGEFLGAREAEHNLILGLSSRLQAAPLMYGEPAYFAVVEEGSRVVGVTMRTPPHNLILSELDDLAAIGPLLEDARSEFASLPGVVGPKEPVARFAQAWSDSARLEIAQRAFRADHVDAPSGVPGQMRDYERGDRELAARWMDAFVEEALPEPPPESSEEFVDRREEDPDGGIVLWEDDGAARLDGRLRRPHAERDPNRAGLHAARAARPRLRERAHRGADAAAARRRAALLLPLHRSRQPDLEQHLPADRLRAGQ